MRRCVLLVNADKAPRGTKRFGPVFSRFTFHVSRLTSLVEQLQRRGKALRPSFAERFIELPA